MKQLITIIIVSIFLTSCASILGLKKNISLSPIQINEEAKGNKIETTFILDSNYFTAISKLADQKMVKNHIQPLQALYYNKAGNNIASIINCNAGGITNLHWERAGDLKVFPPLTPNASDTVSLITLLHACNIAGKIINTEKANTVVIFWNRFMGRQNKRFLKAIRKNLLLAKGSDPNIIYINNDNLYN